MKKKVVKILAIVAITILFILAVYNIYKYNVTGKQDISIVTSNKIYNDSDIYVSTIAKKDNVVIESDTKLKLVDSKGKKVKNTKINYNDGNAIISIPNVEPGVYYLEAKVSSKEGKDTVKQKIVINKNNSENITVTLDKGIYKPGDEINYRALVTQKDTDAPVQSDVNVCIFDGNNNKVYNEKFKTSEYGIMGGKFKLADEVNSGIYKLIIKTENAETTKQFKVNPYVTPKYEVNISMDKESYVVGETAKATINTKYFFGEPVQNAKLKVYLNNIDVKNLTTDDQGNAVFENQIGEAKKYKIKVEAVDSSNYYVEKESSFTAGTDIFNIQLLPEYGKLQSGINNNVYVFTTNNDGTPLKTYVTISSNNNTKQVATDENGIGKFEMFIKGDNTYNRYMYSESQNFSVKAQDMNERVASKEVNLDIENRKTLITTDKAKYEQGEEINLKIQSNDENTKDIYFLRNGKIINTVKTDSNQTTVNLGEEFGLIDVLIKDNQNTYSSQSYFKKTIFVKPKKQLKINIGTDKEEYKPGENISISFDTKKEDDTGIDTALLVSMLDNSILDLADNDMSIDNIKLALQNINFSDELDAATLYSCIIDDKSDQNIEFLLLKQNNTNANIKEYYLDNEYLRDYNLGIAIIAIIVLVIIIAVMILSKYKILKKSVKHIINCFTLEVLIGLIMANIITIFRMYTSSNIVLFISMLAGLIIYILLLSRFEKKITRTTLSLWITINLLILTIALTFITKEENIIIALMCIIGICFLIGAIILRVTEKKHKHGSIYNEFIYIFKYIGAILVSAILVLPLVLLNMVIDGKIGPIIFTIFIILIYIVNLIFNKFDKKENVNYEENNKVKTNILLALTSLLIPIDLFVLMYIYNAPASVVRSATGSMYQSEMRGDYTTNSLPNQGGVAIPMPNSSGSASNSKSSILDSAESFINGKSSKESNISSEVDSYEDNNKEEIKQSETEENIRNVFLESMCFVPELVTQNANANLNLKLSDNITTWTIQAVGNTKDGRIGYGNIDNVRVFKDFFVDFELPKNMIETDNIAVPITVYNYMDNPINTKIVIKEEEWFILSENNVNVYVEPKSTNMVYIPIKVLKAGNNKFRAEVSSDSLTDIVEKECTVSPKGYKVEKVVSTGRIEKNINEDILLLDEIIQDSANVKVKIYSSMMSQTIEGMEKIFAMPTGCFEQISSTLYPNILALKYIEDNEIVNEEIREKALDYISSGYQRLLTYEVKGESGGYSLYGKSPAETVLTAYGLMEVSDLSKVYNVDENVIKKMTNFIYSKQNSNGSFTITGRNKGGAASSNELTLNAYITWALSETNSKDEKLKKSVEYLKGKIDSVKDNYTLALIANTLANVKDKELNNVLKRLVANVKVDENRSYLTTDIVDYYGTRYSGQTIQTVALTSMALSKTDYNPEVNNGLINYLISQKDKNGTWYSTQATILALRALNIKNDKTKLENQTIVVKLNSEEQKQEIKDNQIGIYEFDFKNINKENKLNIDLEKGNAYYEVVEEYYIPFEKVDSSNDKIEVKVDGNFNLNVNDVLNANLQVINRSGSNIANGMVTISIPQGFSVVEESLSKLETSGIIEKYEMTYKKVNIYLREFEANQIVNIQASFRAGYPVKITGLDTRAYDYYNPEIEGKSMPVEIKVN